MKSVKKVFQPTTTAGCHFDENFYKLSVPVPGTHDGGCQLEPEASRQRFAGGPAAVVLGHRPPRVFHPRARLLEDDRRQVEPLLRRELRRQVPELLKLF